jgi:hypothetical protein
MTIKQLISKKASKEDVIEYEVDRLVAKLVDMGYMDKGNKNEIIEEIKESVEYYKTNKLNQKGN